MKNLSCLMGMHDYKTVIGNQKYLDVTRPSCKQCGFVYHLTQGQINKCWDLQSQINELAKQIRDIDNQWPIRRG